MSSGDIHPPIQLLKRPLEARVSALEVAQALHAQADASMEKRIEALEGDRKRQIGTDESTGERISLLEEGQRLQVATDEESQKRQLTLENRQALFLRKFGDLNEKLRSIAAGVADIQKRQDRIEVADLAEKIAALTQRADEIAQDFSDLETVEDYRMNALAELSGKVPLAKNGAMGRPAGPSIPT